MAQTLPKAVQEHKEEPWMTLIERLWKANPFSDWVPVDVGEILSVSQLTWLDAMNHPMRWWELSSDWMQKYTQVMTTSTLKLWGLGQESKPVIEPEANDRRFSAPDWQQNAVFEAIKESYLLLATTWLKAVTGIEGLDERERRRLTFFLNQYLDALSPTNFAFLNPQVIHETIATGGQNLVKGMQHLLHDIQQGEITVTDTSAFQVGKDLAITPGQVVYRNSLMELIQYNPTTPQVHAIPLLHIPPWVNKYYVLDLRPQDSLIEFLVNQGFTVFLISWKNPDASMADISYEDYVTLGPLAALQVIKEITGSPKVNTVGYCIAGELLGTLPSILASRGDDTLNSATFVVTPVDTHAALNDLFALIDEPTIRFTERYLQVMGYLDHRLMALMFNFLRANELVWSNVINDYLLGKEPSAFDISFWNSDGTRVARNAHSFYLQEFVLENKLAKHGELIIKGVPIDLRDLKQDTYVVAMMKDHIVPWKAAWRMTQLVGGPVRFTLGGSGHVAGIVAPRSAHRGYWTDNKPGHTADEWLEGATFHQGSWWQDWAKWLQAHSGELVAPPSIGNQDYPPLVAAPGTYVLEK
jgi:polyhydroxyalkanoate synthase